jgi:DNA-binding PadR family transcriptional regulator
MASRPRRRHDLFQLAVLALLSERPRHPYEMLEMIRIRHIDFAGGHPRSLYHAVDRLLRSGLVEPLETSRDGRRPERTVYTITEDGLQELEAWLVELLASTGLAPAGFSAALSLLPYVRPEAAAAALEERLVNLETGVAALAGVDAALARRLPRFSYLDHEHTRAVMTAEAMWVEGVVKDIRQGGLTWGPAEFRAQLSQLPGLALPDPVTKEDP